MPSDNRLFVSIRVYLLPWDICVYATLSFNKHRFNSLEEKTADFPTTTICKTSRWNAAREHQHPLFDREHRYFKLFNGGDCRGSHCISLTEWRFQELYKDRFYKKWGLNSSMVLQWQWIHHFFKRIPPLWEGLAPSPGPKRHNNCIDPSTKTTS